MIHRQCRWEGFRRQLFLIPQACRQFAMLAMVRYADAALAMTRTILRAWAVDGRIVLADWRLGGIQERQR